MIYQPPSIQHRGFLDPALDHLFGLSAQPSMISSFPPRTDWRVERLQRFINGEHGKLGWNLDRLCKQLDLGVSGSQGAKLFRKHMGIGIREYSKRERLAAAAEKLGTTSLSVKEISADLGYRNQTDFWRQFRQLFFLNPTEFRIAYRQRSMRGNTAAQPRTEPDLFRTDAPGQRSIGTNDRPQHMRTRTERKHSVEPN